MEEFMSLDEFIKQNALKPVKHVLEGVSSMEIEEENEGESLLKPRNRHITSADEWNSILG